MKTLLSIALIAAGITTVATAANARPHRHRHQVCFVHHHHRVCHWR